MKQLVKIVALTAVSAVSIAGAVRPAQALLPAVKGPWYGYYISSMNSSRQGSMSINFTNQSGRQFNFIAMKDGRTYSEQGNFTNDANPYSFNFSTVGTENAFKGSGRMMDYGDGSVFKFTQYQEQKKDFRDQGTYAALRMFDWNDKNGHVMLPRVFKGKLSGRTGEPINCSINFAFQEKSHAGGSMTINFARPVQVLCDGSVSNEKNRDGSYAFHLIGLGNFGSEVSQDFHFIEVSGRFVPNGQKGSLIGLLRVFDAQGKLTGEFSLNVMVP